MMDVQQSQQHQQTPDGQILLCASCDRCRARKTKCDGERPCENCKNRYMKANKLDSVEGIDYAEFNCIYSPAKRRGPIPGKSSTRKAAEMIAYHNALDNSNLGYQNQAGFDGMSSGGGGFQLQNQNNNGGAQFSAEELKQMLLLQQQLLQQQQEMQMQQQAGLLAQIAGGNLNVGNLGQTQVQQVQQQQQQQVQQVQQFDNQMQNNQMMGGMNGSIGGNNMMDHSSNDGQVDQQTLELLQQYQNQLNVSSNQNSTMNNTMGSNAMASPNAFMGGYDQQQQQQPSPMPSQQYDQQPTKRTHRVETAESINTDGLSKSVANHLPLLNKFNRDGNILRSYYDLSVNDVLNLPPIPSDEEYCSRLLLNNIYHYTPENLPSYDHSVLRAARFAELALGALANEQVPLALELSNASVMCMRSCGDEPVHSSCNYEVARAYLLHGIFRSFRGDFVRYFKYRRVCMTYVGQLENVPNVEALIAAVSFHDALAYMLHNASEEALPDIDQVLPRFNPKNSEFDEAGEIESKYGISTNARSVAAEDYNQMWMQGAPPVFLNNEANLANRTLDGLACAIRSCCDHANSQFEEMAKAAGADIVAQGSCGLSTTTKAVMANEDELCSRNIVLSSRALLDQHCSRNSEKTKKHGLAVMAMAMDAFLENSGKNDGVGGFTDKQIKNLLSVSDILVKNPLLLHAPGPVYHMMSNAAIMLCHLLNAMYANCGESPGPEKSDIEEILFGEVFDSYMAMRKLLSGHRKALPVKLRCHGLPKPNVGLFKKDDSNAPFITVGDTMLCPCRGCQGFVLMGCSPCVAAERSAAASKDSYANGAAITGDYTPDQFERELQDMGEFDMGDDALLNVLSRFVE